MRRPGVLHVVAHAHPDARRNAEELVRSTTATRGVLAAPNSSATRLTSLALRRSTAVLHAHGPGAVDRLSGAARALRRPLAVSLATEEEVELARFLPSLAHAALVVVPTEALAHRVDVVPAERVRVVGVGVDLAALGEDLRAHRHEPGTDDATGVWALRAAAGDPARRAHVGRHHELGARTADLERLWVALATGGELWVPRPAASDLTTRVVIVSHDRCRLLERTLDALAAQTLPADEVVVVDNGSRDGTAALLEQRVACGSPRGLRVLTRAANLPVAEGRNLGAAGATTDLLVFTDDDCRPRPTWLECLVAGMADGVDLVQGRTVADPAQPLERLSRTQWTPAEFGLYETCNIAYRRSAFERVGGFDLALAEQVAETLGPRWGQYPFGEDTDLGWRVRRTGARSAFAYHAVVEHEVFAPDRELLVQRASLSAAFPLLVRRVPELRQAFLTAGFVLGKHRVRLWLALLAMVLTSQHGLFLLGTLPYIDDVVGLRRWHRRSGRRARLRDGAVLVRRDLVETAALLRGSARARAIVL